MKKRIILAVRLILTCIIAWWCWGVSITGQTMEPHLPFGAALPFFLFLGLPAALFLVPLWGTGRGWRMVLTAIPLFVCLAFAAARLEERVFIQQHKQSGVGPTARWLVSNHWLAYNAQTEELTGSD